jgi:hypothetical protein
VHCDDYKCDKCGLDLKKKQAWDRHQLRWHRTYDEKLAHSLSQPEGENYLPKIYLLIHTCDVYCKIGWTKGLMSAKLSKLKLQRGETMIYYKCWILSDKFHGKTNQFRVEMLEKEIHVRIPTLGFPQLQGKEEYFWLDKEIENILIAIEAIVDQHEHKEMVAYIPATTAIDPVKRGEKRKIDITQPLEKRLKHREYSKEWREKKKGNYIYFISNEIDVAKLGETSMGISLRIDAHNRYSDYGKFHIVHQWLLGHEYQDKNKRMHLEFQINDALRARFATVGEKQEHFNILPSQNDEAIGIINKIISSL